jgi:hypothetical protein
MTNEKTTNETNATEANPVLTQEALAHLGDGRIAYVKAIQSEDVRKLFPQAPAIQPGIKLFALHAADGTPIMLTDSREAAVANAWSQELETVSVH